MENKKHEIAGLPRFTIFQTRHNAQLVIVNIAHISDISQSRDDARCMVYMQNGNNYELEMTVAEFISHISTNQDIADLVDNPDLMSEKYFYQD